MTRSIRTIPTSRRWLALPVGAACAAMLISVLVVPARAATAPPSPDAASAATATLSPVAQRLASSVPAAVDAYWTPARMASALPADLPDDPKVLPSSVSTDVPAGAPSGSTPAAAPSAVPPAANAVPITGPDGVDVNASPTVGRVFFYSPEDDRNHSCSGSALNSASKRLVITAGHCVHGGEGGSYMQNWVFVPYYNHGDRPYGTFAARTYRTFDAWRNDSSWAHDVAMVTTWMNEDSQRVVNAVGGNGLSWNYSKTIYLTVLAYPAESPYDGTWQHYCRGTTSIVYDGRISLKCGFTGGASGGPWLRAYSDSTRRGNVNGVMSTLTGSGWNRSPYFDSKVKSMYDATAGD